MELLGSFLQWDYSDPFAAQEATAQSLVPTAAYGDIGLGTEL